MMVRNKKTHKNQLVINKTQARKASKAIQQQVSAAKAALNQAAQGARDVYARAGTAAQNLIQTGARATLTFFKDVAAMYDTCKPVEHLYASYQRDLADYRDTFPPETLAALQKQLAQWRGVQIHRILNHQTIEAFAGINEALAQNLQRTEPPHGTPSTLAGASGPTSLVGGVPPGDTEVWAWGNRYEIMSGRYRTAVIEYFETGLETVRPKTGMLEPVVFTPVESSYKRTISATTTDRHIPLPTQLRDDGQPDEIYWVDPKVGRVDWSPELGQFFLTLTQKPADPQTVTIETFRNNRSHNPELPQLTRATATQAAPRPNAAVKAALSPFTRQVFEAAQKMGRTDLYGIYALTPYEQLQYAAARLQGSWTYDRDPKNLTYAKAKGVNWLGDLHEDTKVTTANCNVSNTELAVAARAFGYPVRIVTGFLGNARPGLTAPGHEWIEVRVGNRYCEMDATPIYKLFDRVANLNADIQHKLRMIAEYDQNPRYRERDALYAQLPNHLDAAILGKLFTTLSELPIEEERLDALGDDQNRYMSDQQVVIQQQLAPDRFRMDVYDRDPLQPNEQGRYRGYTIKKTRLYGINSTVLDLVKDVEDILVWDIDVELLTASSERQKLTLKTPLTLNTITGTIDPDRPEYVSLPGHPRRKFRICNSIEDISHVWNPLDKNGRSLLVEGLQKLRFVPVQVDMEKFDREGHLTIDHRHFAFNAEHGLLIDDYFNDGADGINLGVDPNGKKFELRISPDYSRILSTALSTITYREHTNHAVTYANAFFEHMEGKPVVSATDRGLLVRALSLLLRHPPELRNCDWNDLAATSYLLSEARRLNIRAEEIKNVTTSAVSRPKAVICDGIRQTGTTPKPGCDVEWAASPATSDPASVDTLWVVVMHTLSQLTRMKGVNTDRLSPSQREWLEKLFRKEFKPAGK